MEVEVEPEPESDEDENEDDDDDGGGCIAAILAFRFARAASRAGPCRRAA